jgi:hypothetical protein
MQKGARSKKPHMPKPARNMKACHNMSIALMESVAKQTNTEKAWAGVDNHRPCMLAKISRGD